MFKKQSSLIKQIHKSNADGLCAECRYDLIDPGVHCFSSLSNGKNNIRTVSTNPAWLTEEWAKGSLASPTVEGRPMMWISHPVRFSAEQNTFSLSLPAYL